MQESQSIRTVEGAIEVSRELHGHDGVDRFVEVDTTGRAFIMRMVLGKDGLPLHRPVGAVVFYTCKFCEARRVEGETFFPGHFGSRRCANARAGATGAIAAGGTRAHCTCDVCF